MDDSRRRPPDLRSWRIWPPLAIAAAVVSAVSCRANPAANSRPAAILRGGVAQLSSANPIQGIRQLSQILSVESLVRVGEDGRLEPWLAEKWTSSNSGRLLTMTLRPGVRFHDGSPADATTIAGLLPDALRSQFGVLINDVTRIGVSNSNTLEIEFRRSSPLLLEMLEASIRKPGPGMIGTGPFVVSQDSTNLLRANADYYLGRPKIDAWRIETFPSVRTAWAELLRDRLDMLYEVAPDALESLQSATNVAVFTFTRHYQYLVVLNSRAPALKSKEVRQALSIALDRNKLVQDALNGHGVPSSGPMWPRYWALPDNLPTFRPDPERAAQLLRSHNPGSKRAAGVTFTCLIPADATYERIALALKRQFDDVGADMQVRAASQDEIYQAEKSGNYEAILIEGISAPSLLRLQYLWASTGGADLGFGNAAIDAAFERVKAAENEGDYRRAVLALQEAFMDDPPALFLTWTERARAVSKRFVVPSPEPGRDVMSTVHLWAPSDDGRMASRN
jgi:peptide/nickel transport system substrate-binding protein